MFCVRSLALLLHCRQLSILTNAVLAQGEVQHAVAQADVAAQQADQKLRDEQVSHCSCALPFCDDPQCVLPN